MDWRKLLERIGIVVFTTIGSCLAGGLLGGVYYRMSDAATGWDGIALVIGGLGLGSLLGFAVGLYLAVRLDEASRRKTLLVTFVLTLLFVLVLAVLNVFD